MSTNSISKIKMLIAFRNESQKEKEGKIIEIRTSTNHETILRLEGVVEVAWAAVRVRSRPCSSLVIVLRICQQDQHKVGQVPKERTHPVTAAAAAAA